MGHFIWVFTVCQTTHFGVTCIHCVKPHSMAHVCFVHGDSFYISFYICRVLGDQEEVYKQEIDALNSKLQVRCTVGEIQTCEAI